jgi:Tetratricopeptide repeat
MRIPQRPTATTASNTPAVGAHGTIADSLHNVEQCLAAGRELSQKGLFAEAEICFRRAIEVAPDHPMAHNNLGWVRHMQGDPAEAIVNYRHALQVNPSHRLARRNLALLLVQEGRRDESFDLFHAELATGSEGVSWLIRVITTAMQAEDLTLAGEYAAILAELRWGSPWYPTRDAGSTMPLSIQSPDVFLTIPKLRHDIEQFEYLQHHGILGDEFTPIIRGYEHVIDRMAANSVNARVPLTPEDQRSIGPVYNRLVHIRQTPRVQRVFSDTWDPGAVESQYLEKPLGLVIVDDFLSEEALESVRLFCLESTVWSTNRYAHGRLGAFFRDGFNCPLLLQIAEELRHALPKVIIDRYPLRQMWGFKYGEYLPAGSTIHADFAAVNVNFWITSEDANLDETSGGLIVYDVDAPLTWDFDSYNGRPDLINAFLQQQHAHAITIPYRSNRAIIFNSDLFHASDGMRFRPGYEHRRVNITMLYGDRESDVHHRNLARQDIMSGANGGLSAWRSAAFSRARSGRGA